MLPGMASLALSSTGREQTQWTKPATVELHWLKHLLNHENMFETELVRANESKS